MNAQRVLTTGEAVALIEQRTGRRVAPLTVRRWLDDGTLLGFRLGARHFIRRESLDKILAGLR